MPTPSTVATRFTTANSPFTGKAPMRAVPIPDAPKMRKGRTKYDKEFETLLPMKSALEFPDKSFSTVRRAFQRFIEFRELKGKVAVRQQLNKETRMVTLWLEKK